MPAKDFAFAWSFYIRRKGKGRNNDFLPIMAVDAVPCLISGVEVQGNVVIFSSTLQG